MRKQIIVHVYTLYGYGYCRRYEVMYDDGHRLYCKRIEYINDFNEVKDIVEGRKYYLSTPNITFNDTWLKVFNKPKDLG